MSRVFATILFFVLVYCPVYGNAVPDSTYTALILGSAEYKPEWGITQGYARPQAELIKQLTSVALAERALRITYNVLVISKTETQIKADAKVCAQSLRISHRSDDTVWLALGHTSISNLDHSMYLDNLLDAFIEDNLTETFRRNQKTVDSLETLADKRSMQLHTVEDTLFTFCNTPGFTKESLKLLQVLKDTVRVMKQKVNGLVYPDTFRTQQIFRATDTLLAQMSAMYADSLSESFQLRKGEVNLMVFKLEMVLIQANITLRMLTTFQPKNKRDSIYFARQTNLLLEIVEAQLGVESLQRTVYTSEKYDMPVKGKKLQPVLSRYRKTSLEYHTLQELRMKTVVDRAGLTPRGKILCRASSYPCKFSKH
ncbi:MAG TPA: hypothetical protein VK826_02065 [Bacteroidia bacterium]|nr:hypothetical protein [Bacteroidia bacterium]